jgi:hypothetical protein
MLPAFDNAHNGYVLRWLGPAQKPFEAWGDCIFELLQRWVLVKYAFSE